MTRAHLYFAPVNVHGTTLRLPSHRAVQWLGNPAHEAGRWQVLRHHVRPDAVIYDVGAEQGDLSALLASWAVDGALVLVEPNGAAWPSIRATFDENGLRPPVAAYTGFVGAVDGEGWATGITHGWPEMGDTVDPAAGMSNLAAGGAPTITLDELAASVTDERVGRPTVLNIDVEGGEMEVLQGASHVLSNDRPVIALSVHPELLADHWGESAASVLAVLDAHNYRCDLVHADHELHYVCVPR